ncbi:MAG: hypothetical protein NC398_06565 [Acetatifactor muris]|nr:hypothetical protein [Acetatifactor muris]MCM1526588.1 hypothetical protein [Bacteroides sp.]
MDFYIDRKLNTDFLKEHKKSMEKLCAGFNKCEKRKVALMSLERQFKAYQQLAKDRQWDSREEYREIPDTCWDAILNNREFAFGNIFAANMESFLEMLLDDTGGEVSFCLLNIDFILNYLDEDKAIQDKNVASECIKREVENQSNDVVQQKNLKNLTDVRNWYEQTDNLMEHISNA